MVTQERLYTAEDLWELSQRPENAGKRFRLIEGVLYEVSPTGWLHGKVTWLLTIHVGNFVLAHSLGHMTGAETGYVLYRNPDGKDTVLAPDLAFIRQEQGLETVTEQYVPFAPDLAVEVMSPSNTDVEITSKVDAYLRYGTRMVWVVFPKEQRLLVYRPTGEANEANLRFLSIDDMLDGEDVLPGFTLPLRQLFET